MAEPFERRPSPGGGFVSRLFGGGSRANAARRIEELLARTRRVRDVPTRGIEEIAADCGVDLEKGLRAPRLNLYRRFFEYCLVDQQVSAEESEDLSHLRHLLRLADDDARRVHDEVARKVYGQAIEQVLEDQRLDPDEEEFLQKLRRELHIPEETAEDLISEGRERARRRYLDRVIARDDFLVTSRDVTLELTGESEHSVEDAVRRTIDEATRAVAGLHFVEITQIGAEVREGRVARWRVKLRGKRESDEADAGT